MFTNYLTLVPADSHPQLGPSMSLANREKTACEACGVAYP